MNLLPFVMIIIVIFSLFSASHLQTAFTQTKEKKLYCTYFKGLRTARNNKIKNFRAEHKPLASRDKVKPVTTYFRVERVGWANGRLNLSSLLSDATYRKILHDVAVNYIELLYKDTKCFPKEKGFAQKLLASLVQAYKKNPQLAFHEVHFKDKKMQEIFYKMVRGTHSYCLEPKRGCPPFANFFTFEPSSEPSYFDYANTTLLTALFGEKFTKNLVQEELRALEKKRRRCEAPIKKENFRTMLSEAFIPNSNELYSLLNFTYAKSSRIVGKFQDEETKLTVLAP